MGVLICLAILAEWRRGFSSWFWPSFSPLMENGESGKRTDVSIYFNFTQPPSILLHFQVRLCIIPKLIYRLSVLKGESYGKWLLIFTIITEPESHHQPLTCWKWYLTKFPKTTLLTQISFQKWDKRAAKSAQKWADKCLQLNHDSPTGRWVKNFGSCGQNIFIATHKVPWYEIFSFVTV